MQLHMFIMHKKSPCCRGSLSDNNTCLAVIVENKWQFILKTSALYVYSIGGHSNIINGFAELLMALTNRSKEVKCACSIVIYPLTDKNPVFLGNCDK